MFYSPNDEVIILSIDKSNIEEVIAHVEKLGIDASQRGSGAQVKTLMIADPHGNHIALAEALDKSMAR